MSLSSQEVMQRLEREGLATAAQCQRWAVEVGPTLTDANAANGLKLLQRLSELGLITKYQAKILAGQSSGALRWGAWLVEQPVKFPLWQGWYWMRRDEGLLVWGRPVRKDDLAPLRDLLPSLPRALQLSKIQHPALAKWFLPELIDGELLVTLLPPMEIPSRPTAADISTMSTLLVQRFDNQRCSAAEATRIIVQLGEALAALHGNNVVHGRVFPDRVYVHEQQVTLVVDPLCAATGRPDSNAKSVSTTGVTSSGLIAPQMQRWQVGQFSAPELSLPHAIPTAASDVYSLGCLWWWLLTSEPPKKLHPSHSESSTHVSTSLPPLPAGVSLPEPQWRCLQACLAENLASRFASANELIRALAAAERAIAAVKSAASPSESVEATQSQVVTRASDESGKSTSSAQQSEAAWQTKAQTAVQKGIVDTNARPSSALEVTAIPRRRKRRGVPWLWPILGVSCALVGLLLLLQWTGALVPSPEAKQPNAARPKPEYVPSGGPAIVTPVPEGNDPRSEIYEIVAANSIAPHDGLWVPPSAPDPILLDLLPPGGQIFISWHPVSWNKSTAAEELRTVLALPMNSLEATMPLMAGVPSANIEQVTLAYYTPEASGLWPVTCWRFRLQQPMAVGELKTVWNIPLGEEVAAHRLLVSGTGQSYYIANLTDDERQMVSDFSVGPREVMVDAIELSGARGPLSPQLERLWGSSDNRADLSLIVSTPFLFTDGRELLNSAPPRFGQHLKQWLGSDVRAVSLQMRFEPSWYLETRVVGANDTDAAKMMARQQQEVQSLPTSVEQWLVGHSAHPYWRALAIRYPHMLRTFADYTRFGVEQGAALMNCYLPSDGGTNLLLASWIAIQQQSTQSIAADAAASPAEIDSAKPMDIETYLARPISLSFDQEPIEVALRLVGEEANSALPSGTAPHRFLLDGGAFEKGGITRNQQLRGFQIERKSVREALTEIAKLGNPDRTVSDLQQEKQSLVWVVRPDPESESGASMISLTTRTAANEAGIQLPSEFAK